MWYLPGRSRRWLGPALTADARRDVQRDRSALPPELPVPQHDEGARTPDKAVTTHEPEPKASTNGHKPQTPPTSTVERDAAPHNGAHAKAPDRDSSLEKPADEKKKSRRWGRRVRKAVWVAAAAAAAFALIRGHAELRIGGPFNVLPVENSDVRTAGRLFFLLWLTPLISAVSLYSRARCR